MMWLFIHEPPPLIRAERFTQRDLEMAANDIILAMDGKISRQNALFCARAAFESKGMEKTVERDLAFAMRKVA